MNHDTWNELLSDHKQAVQDFVAHANRVPEESWELPRSEGKWTPGQETEHLIKVHSGLVRSLQESVEIRQILPKWKSRLLRWILVPRILKGKFPKGAIAPRGTRPEPASGPRVEQMAKLHEYAASFEIAIDAAYAKNGRGTITHPYFGPLSFAKFLKINAEHTRHHQRHLP